MSNMTTVQVYGADQVSQVLHWPLINESAKAAFVAISNADPDIKQRVEKLSYVNQPARSITQCGVKRSQVLLTMPSFVGDYTLSDAKATRNTLACKMVTSFAENSTKQPPLPNILANILLFNTETGALEAVCEGTQITAWRTAGASVVATQYLYLQRESTKMNAEAINVAIIGCGVQGESHALGMCATFNVGNVYLWNRTKDKAENLATLLRNKYHPKVNIIVCTNPAAAVAEADVICTATRSPSSLINKSMFKKDTVHINAVGATQVHFGEVDQDIYDVADVYIDSWANAKTELQNLKANIIGEVGKVITSQRRLPKNGITVFQSMGMAAQDAVVCHAVVEAIKRSKYDTLTSN